MLGVEYERGRRHRGHDEHSTADRQWPGLLALLQFASHVRMLFFSRLLLA